MNWRRRIELTLGLLTGALAFIATGMMLKGDYEIAVRLKKPFAWVWELVIFSLLLVLPGLAVAIGSYAHTTKDRDFGRVLVVFGGLVLAWQLRLLFASGLYGLRLWLVVLILLATAAVLTIIASFVTAAGPDLVE